jgi:Protein of unknown function (DUF3048) N-terminal domain/Protein of unknown function (DUF3048) C-terminal domain
MRRLRLRVGLAPIALLGVALLGLPACGGDDADAAANLGRVTTTTTTTTTTVPTTTTAPPTFPLTGMPLTDAAAATRPALVVKIDNIDTNRGRARPQMGINQADVVYEELVEGGITRFLTVFHSTGSNPVGPVRSARTSDISIFSPLNRPLFAWSGAASWVVPRIQQSPIQDIGHGSPCGVYSRRGDRRAPHNLYSATSAMYGCYDGGSGAPPALFTYRTANAPLGAGARPLGGVDLIFGQGLAAALVQYRWHPAGGWLRWQSGTPHTDESGAQVGPQNVIVQFTPYGWDSPSVPLAQVEGTGSAWVLTNGHLIPATWHKSAPNAVTQYVDAAGRPIGLTPGRTWVALVAHGGAAQGSAVIV